MALLLTMRKQARTSKDNDLLQNFVSLLEHRISQLEEREAPAIDGLVQLKRKLGDMSEELFNINKQR